VAAVNRIAYAQPGSLFRIWIFAYPVHSRFSQPFPGFLSQLSGAMQRELRLEKAGISR